MIPGEPQRGRGLILTTIAGTVILLISITAWKPNLFGIIVGIIGTTGALLVLYEVNHTKRIAQATFVRDLNTAFTTDPAISEMWRKLLMDEKIERSDRPLISSYLTFFETIHLLLDRDVIDFRLVDNLFRNRFFTAIGNSDIHELALFAQLGSFLNIHDLVRSWSKFIAQKGIPQHDGYYKYLQASARFDGFLIRQLNTEDISGICKLQEDVATNLEKQDWLRNNDDQMWAECIQHHITLGVFSPNQTLAAVAVLFDAGNGKESIANYVTSVPARIKTSINLKVVLVAPTMRRNYLAHTLVALLERDARNFGKTEILCTIHKRNSPSRDLFKSVGYKKIGSARTEYGKRHIYSRSLVQPRLRRNL